MPRIIITEPDKNPQPYRFDLATDSVKIGRAAGNEIVLECGSISGIHAEMARVRGGFEIRDLGATNGISKDGDPIDVWVLSDGDELLLGDVGFEFHLSEEEAAELAAELDVPAEKDASSPASPLPDLPVADPPPAAGARPVPVRSGQTPPAQTRGVHSGWLLVLAFLILGSLAFYAGLSLRHKNETGVTLGQVIMKRLSTPDITRITAITGEKPDDVFVQPVEEPADEEEIVVAPIEPEAVPVEIEGWENRERPEGWEEEQEREAEGIEALLQPNEEDEEMADDELRDEIIEDSDGEEIREREPFDGDEDE